MSDLRTDLFRNSLRRKNPFDETRSGFNITSATSPYSNDRKRKIGTRRRL